MFKNLEVFGKNALTSKRQRKTRHFFICYHISPPAKNYAGTLNAEQENAGEEKERTNDEEDDVYEEYRDRYQMYIRNSKSRIPFRKISKEKWMGIITLLFFLVAGLAASLAIHFRRSSTTSTTSSSAPKAVLMISTYSAKNVPVVISLNGL